MEHFFLDDYAERVKAFTRRIRHENGFCAKHLIEWYPGREVGCPMCQRQFEGTLRGVEQEVMRSVDVLADSSDHANVRLEKERLAKVFTEDYQLTAQTGREAM